MSSTPTTITSQTRRSFIKTAGIVSAAGIAASAALSGVGTALADQMPMDAVDWDEEFDIVIVGAGVAGAAAAVTVATEGQGATCLLAEKMSSPMGNTPFSDGSVLFGNDVEALYAYMKEMAGEHATTPDETLRVYAEAACGLKDWIFGDLGANYETSGTSEPTTAEDFGGNSAAEYPEYEHSYSVGKIRLGKGEGAADDEPKHIIQHLNKLIAEHADVIDFRCDFGLTDLVRDWATGRVVGAVIGGKNIKANKGVIMCCGGFEANAQMKADYLSAPWARRIAGRCNEGDGITMCARCGADMWHMNSCAGFWTSMSAIDSDTCLMRTPKDQGITVGVNGRRFYMDWDTDVSLDWDTFTERDLRMHVGSRHGHMQFGGEWPHLPMPAVTWLFVGAAGYQSILENKMMNITWDPMDGWGYSADTLEGLAETIGVPAEELVRSVEQWDECCTNGEDVYFHRPASTLNPIGDGPYYALYCPPTMLNTDGGPRRSAKGEILDLDGQPIPHLYSAGEFGSIWANMYQGAGNLGECLAFGRISARNCLGIA